VEQMKHLYICGTDETLVYVEHLKHLYMWNI